jgi:DNA ligase (NAD+)
MIKEYFEIPTSCPECGGDVKIEGAYLVCTNEFCSGLATGNLERWINDGVDVDDIGGKLIQVLYEKDMVKEPADFYKLSVEQVAGLERMGERSATKVITNLRAKMSITLSDFIAGLNMPNFSKQTAETLMAAGYDDIVKMFNAQETDLVCIKGVGEKTAKQIIKGMKSKATVIKNLFDVGITIKQPEKIKVDSNIFAGKSFCFTGRIESINPKTEKNYTRDEMHAIVKANGGQVEDSVKKGLSYLVQIDPASESSKSKNAKKFDVQIISEKTFFEMLKNQ